MQVSSFLSDDTNAFFEMQAQALGMAREDLRRIQAEKECRVRLVFPAETRQLELVRRFARKTAAVAPGLDEETAEDIALALDEACTNVIRHAYPDPVGDALIEAEIRISSDAITIVLVDEGERGRGFHPCRVAPLDVTKLRLHPRAGGLGLHLIRKIMDEVHYEEGPGRSNRLTMRRFIPTRK